MAPSSPTGFTLPAPEERFDYPILVVGNTLAAYTATLAALRAGEQVCWITADRLGQEAFRRPDYFQEDSSLVNRVGHRFRLGGDQFAISLSQRQFRRRLQVSGPPPQSFDAPLAAPSPAVTAPASSLKPYLEQQQLTVMAPAQPQMVLHKQSQGQRQMMEVRFRHRATDQLFAVRAAITIEATAAGELLRLGQLECSHRHPYHGQAQLKLAPHHCWRSQRPGRSARGDWFDDSVGICHAQSGRGGRGYEWLVGRTGPVLPVTLPLRALLPVNLTGLIYGGPALGLDHRLDALGRSPQGQWAVGEAAGQVAAFSRRCGLSPQAILADHRRLRQLQQRLLDYGVPLVWFDDVAQDDPDFAAIQRLALEDVMRSSCDRNLHFRPEVPVTRAVLASALARLAAVVPLEASEFSPLPVPVLRDVTGWHWADAAITTVIRQGWMLPLQESRFYPTRVVTQQQLVDYLKGPLGQPMAPLIPDIAKDDQPVKRRVLARLLFRIHQARQSP